MTNEQAFEQLSAHCDNTAQIVANYFLKLLEAKVPEPTASVLVRDFQQMLLHSLLFSESSEGGPEEEEVEV